MYIATHPLRTSHGALAPGQPAPGAEAWPELKTLLRMGRLLRVADGKEREVVEMLRRGEMPPVAWAPSLRIWDAVAIRRRMGTVPVAVRMEQDESVAAAPQHQTHEPKRKRRKDG
jgi:hypothetical protein